MASNQVSGKVFGEHVAACILAFLSKHNMGGKNRVLFSCQPGTAYCTFYMGGVCIGIKYDGDVLDLSAASAFRVTKSNMLYYKYSPDDFHDTVMLSFEHDLEAIYDALSACASSGLRTRFIWPFSPISDSDDGGAAEKNKSRPVTVDKSAKKCRSVDKSAKKRRVGKSEKG